MGLETIQGDLLQMPTGEQKYIVQQCCCTGTAVAGLSSAIAKKWPTLNPYKKRTPIGRTRTATFNSRPEPGTAEILKHGPVNLVCLYGQYAPGKGGLYEDDETEPYEDYKNTREGFFQSALQDMKTKINADSTLYIPHGIGCGLAGGKWENYEKMLQKFSHENPAYNIVVVKLL
jgi:hypothetical protein